MRRHPNVQDLNGLQLGLNERDTRLLLTLLAFDQGNRFCHGALTFQTGNRITFCSTINSGCTQFSYSAFLPYQWYELASLAFLQQSTQNCNYRSTQRAADLGRPARRHGQRPGATPEPGTPAASSGRGVAKESNECG